MQELGILIGLWGIQELGILIGLRGMQELGILIGLWGMQELGIPIGFREIQELGILIGSPVLPRPLLGPTYVALLTVLPAGHRMRPIQMYLLALMQN
jgi:hypothetical protein